MRDLGNTVIVVEHDEETIRSADWVIDLGPGAGLHGGGSSPRGRPRSSSGPESLTGEVPARASATIPIPERRRDRQRQGASSSAARASTTCRTSTRDFPLGVFTAVTGVSGSGKVDPGQRHPLPGAGARTPRRVREAGRARQDRGLLEIDKVIDIDQAPIGRTPRSNPATYTNVFNPIRELMARTPEARARGYEPGRFSFNVKGGRCEACAGDGQIKIEMHFLPDIYVTCDVCGGKRYNRETLQVRYKGKSIADILELTVEQALEVFANVPAVANICRPSTRSASATSSSASPRRRSPAARRSASSSPASSRGARRAARSTCSTSRRPACTSTTSTSCSASCSRWSRRATRWS